MEKETQKIWNFFLKITEKELNMNEYPDRLMLQKIVYLLQETGINFGYDFNWYVKGPYCTQLAADSFDLFEQKIKPKSIKLSEKENKLIKNLKKDFTHTVKSDNELELLGSLVYIRNQMKIKEKSAVIEKLMSLKPWYEKDAIEKMLKKIENSQLFN
ncbi:MAG: hypothetical protein Q7K34_00655 [archaeon]|nr:hypothetical protein [archaeon]